MYFPSLGQRGHFIYAESLLGGQKGEGTTLQYGMLICDSIGLWAGIHHGEKLHTHVREGPRIGQVWKNKQINCLKVKRPKRTVLYK